jgi:hypothetical protein
MPPGDLRLSKELSVVPIQELTDPNAVRAAMAECDQMGRDAFLSQYGFHRALRYVIEGPDGTQYDSKAIAGVAYGKQFPTRGPLKSTDFSGGEATVKPVLEHLGFAVVDTQETSGSENPPDQTLTSVPRVWVEKTIVRDRPDREHGPHSLGQALWSPQRGAGNRDIYANMRDVMPGDWGLSGISCARGR